MNEITIAPGTRYTNSGEEGFGFFQNGQRISLKSISHDHLGNYIIGGHGLYWVPTMEQAEAALAKENGYRKGFADFYRKYPNAL